MTIKDKKTLSNVTYYTLLIIAIAMAVLAILYTLNRALPTWARIVYVIWACAVIITLIFDVFCTINRRMKFVSGAMVYVLSVASVVVTAILYLANAGLAAGLTTAFMPVFAGTAAIIISTSIYMIATFIVGESVVEHDSAIKSTK